MAMARSTSWRGSGGAKNLEGSRKLHQKVPNGWCDDLPWRQANQVSTRDLQNVNLKDEIAMESNVMIAFAFHCVIKGVAKTNLLTFLASLTKDQLQHFSSSHLWSQCLWTCSLPPQQWHSPGPSWVISEELKFTPNSLLVDQSKSGATLQPKGTFWWKFPLPSRFLAHHFLSRTNS